MSPTKSDLMGGVRLIFGEDDEEQVLRHVQLF